MTPRIYFDPVKGDYVFDGALGADAVFTDSLYAEQGDIAELTVDRLSTSKRVRLYNLQNTGDDNFVEVQDNYIKFITGTPIEDSQNPGTYLTEQATNRYGQALYWAEEPYSINAQGYPLDEDGNQIYATIDTTNWPVMVYQYTELVKAQFAFEQQSGTYVPILTLGAGDENGRDKGYLLKGQNELMIRYLTGAGEYTDIRMSDFVDAKHRRLASCEIDTVNGEVTYTVEGDGNEYSLTFVVNGDTVTYTWPDGHTCEVNII